MTDDRRGAPPGEDPNVWAARSALQWIAAAAVSAVAMTVVLAWAPTKEFLRPWRRVQADYNRQAAREGRARIDVRVRQVWIPEVQRADRCGTCHLAMAGEAALSRPKVFAAHPRVAHPTEEYGCTWCHSGQGWATERADAHGASGSWPNPIYRGHDTEAGCGTCHSGIPASLPEDLDDVEQALARYGCEKCHGEGREGAPDLRSIALRGVPEGWVGRHALLTPPNDNIVLPTAAEEKDLRVLGAWLSIQVGAPRLARGKMLFFGRGCMGCHRRGKVGADVGPDLTAVGDKDVRDLTEHKGAGPDTFPKWLREHFLDPQKLVQGSRMPPLDPDDFERATDLDDLVTYVLSLRAVDVPDRLTPPDRARVRYGLGRDFPTSGRGLFVTFCSACHGADAGGVNILLLKLTTPAVGSRGFLAKVTPRHIRATLLRGRRSSLMPAFGPDDAGLMPAEIGRLVDYLWSRRAQPRAFARPAKAPDAKRGQASFEKRCSTCHAPGRAGPRLGRDLTAAGATRFFTDELLWDALQHGWVEEGMPSYASLDDGELHDLVAHLRGLSAGPAPVGPAIEADRRAVRLGASIWAGQCAACHGVGGEGGSSHLLNTGPYLAWASDAYLATRVLNHEDREARHVIGAPSDRDLAALLGYVRAWSGQASPAEGPRPDPAAVARGQILYDARCVTCHGKEGAGKTGPALASADFQEIVSRPFLTMTILEGREGTAMSALQRADTNAETLRNALDLADYVRSLRGRAAVAAVETAPGPPEKPAHQER